MFEVTTICLSIVSIIFQIVSIIVAIIVSVKNKKK
jgi:hypothetical protein